jgi:hypothetical protein
VDDPTTSTNIEPAAPQPAQTPPVPPTEPAPPTEPTPTRASEWRPPASDPGRNAALVFGVIILIVGLWYFATQTLDLDLPDLDWGQLWPVALIGLGVWIVLNALRRRSS